jgi:hypothetical protein
MATRNRMLDDAARLAGGALGTLASLRREAEAQARQQFERLLAGLDLVTRDEFEAVKAMAAKAREENEALSARLDALEKGSKPAARPRKKPSR